MKDKKKRWLFKGDPRFIYTREFILLIARQPSIFLYVRELDFAKRTITISHSR